MDIVCPECNTQYTGVDEKFFGKTAKCEKCSARFTIDAKTSRRPAPDSDEELSTEEIERHSKTGPMDQAPEPQESDYSDTISQDPVMETVRADEPEPAAPLETVYAEEPGGDVVEDGGPAVTLLDGGDQAGDGAAATVRMDESPEMAGDSMEDTGPEEWEIGDVIVDLYKVNGLLGEGGMGKVFKVYHQEWNIDLAVKSPKASELKRAGGAETFVREAETWVNLGLHPNTVSCYYVRNLGGIPRVFAEFVDGGSMQDWIQEGKLYDLGAAIDVAIQFAWGLGYAHDRGIVHQDIKPANVMLTGKGVAKVTDFGLAKARGLTMDEGGEDGLVAFGGMTPAYCSPEQAEKQPLSFKTDIWSWALSILEMFTGEVTWMYGVAANEALDEYLSSGPKNPALPKMPGAVSEILKLCFSQDVSERPDSMLEVAEALIDVYKEITGSAYPRQVPKAGRASADSLNNRAISFLDLGRSGEAVKLWEEALINEPHHPQSTYNSGLVRWRLGEITDMAFVRQMEEAVKSHGKESDCEYYLGLAHLERDDCESAISTLEKVGDVSLSGKEAREAITEAEERMDQSRKEITTLKEHSSHVTALAVSGDGAVALSGGDDKTSVVWDINEGKKLKSFDEGEYSATAVALDQAGKMSLTGSYKTVKFRDIESGQIIREFDGHDSWVISAGLSADGRTAMTGSWDGTVKIWDVVTGDMKNSLEGHMGYASLNSDGSRVLFGSEDNTVKLLDAGSGAVLQTFEVVPGAQSLSADGSLALLADVDSVIYLFDTATGDAIQKFEGSQASITSVALNAEGTVALSCGYDRYLKMWSVKTGRCLRTFEGHEDTVAASAFNGEGTVAVTGGYDKALKLWWIEGEGRKRAPLMVSRVQASEMVLSAGAAYEKKLTMVRDALSAGDTIMASRHIKEARSQMGFSRGAEAVEAWGELYSHLPRKTLNGGWESRSFRDHEGEVNSVALNFDGSLAITSGQDRTLKLWDTATTKVEATLEGHADRVNSADIDSDGRVAVSGSGDGAIKSWELETGKEIAHMAGHTGAVHSVVLMPGGEFTVSGGADRSVRIWETKTGRPIRSMRAHQGGVYSVALSLDGRIAMSGSEDRTARLWDLAAGKVLSVFSGHNGAVTGVAITADKTRVVTCSQDGAMILWDAKTNKQIRVFEGHEAPLTSVAISYDGKFLVSSDEGGVVRFWDLNSGENLRVFTGHTAAVKHVVISPDGRFALSSGADGLMKLWTLDWELDERDSSVWDEGAETYITNSLTVKTPYSAKLPEGRDPFEKEIVSALTREGQPVYSEVDYQVLLKELGCAGFGWLDNPLIRGKLDAMTKAWQGPPSIADIYGKEETVEEEDTVGEEEETAEEESEELGEQEAKTMGMTQWLKKLTIRKEG